MSIGTVHALSSLLTSRLSESGVLTRRDMQKELRTSGLKLAANVTMNILGENSKEMFNYLLINLCVAKMKYDPESPSHHGRTFRQKCIFMDYIMK